MNSELEIAIIGGGPGGLTLCRILQCQGMKAVKVYEKEESRYTREQGGSLDLHKDGGQYALKVAKLLDEFNQHCRNEGQDMRVLDKHGICHYEEVSTTNSNNDRPEIDRSKLRDILLNSLEEDTVKWGYTLVKVSESKTGKVQLSFGNGQTTEADFVVGADGAWSKVRPYLSPAKPIYSGISFVEMTLTGIDDSSSDLSTMVGRGTLFALSSNKAIFAQRNDSGIVRVYAGLRVPEDWFSTLDVDFSDLRKAKEFVLTLFEGWDEKILDLIRANSGEFTQRLICALPVNHSWTRDVDNDTLASRMTLLGDAAHVMSPFAGEGVNLAMKDAACLATVFTSHSNKFQSALIKHEKEMFARSAASAKQSADNLEMMFGPDGAVGLANLMKEFHTWYFLIKYGLIYIYQRMLDTFCYLVGWKQNT